MDQLLKHEIALESVRESCPRREQFRDEATYEQSKRIPLFLFLAACKR
jgi:hypothetical protein